MKRGLVYLLAVGVLALGSTVLAAPQPLSSADLDQVVAGEATASLDNAVAVDGDGSANTAAGALAAELGTAVNGDENTLTYDPSNSAIAYADSHVINAGDNDYGTALAADNSQANYSYDPSDSAVNLGDCNTATNFYDNDDVANATDDAIAVGYAEDAATAAGTNNQAFEANGDIGIAVDGQAVGYAEDSAINIGDDNLAIEDSTDVTFATDDGVVIQESGNVALAQDNGTAFTNDGELALTDSGIAFANPSDTALAFGEKSIAIEDPTDVALASDSAIAINADVDALIATNCSATFESNDDVANTTGTGVAIATDDAVAVATNGAIANAYPSDFNLAIHGNAAQSTSDGQAVAGDDNFAIFQYVDDGIIATECATVNYTENEIENTTVDFGSAAVIGHNNDICAVYDDATITVQAMNPTIQNTEIEIAEFNEEGSALFGVVAKNAAVNASFNYDEQETEVDATIDDSFNVDTNAICISGQSDASSIALVNSLGDPQSGINMNVTSASASIPTVPAAAPPGVTAGISTATTELSQFSLNDSSTLTLSF